VAKVRSDEEKRAASEDLYYEIEMFFACAEWLGRYPLEPSFSSEEERIAYNTYVEAFVVHMRCLIDFFRKEEKDRRQDDVLPADFSSKWTHEWIACAGEKTCIDLNELFVRASQRLAHLTYNRPSTRWCCASIARKLGTIIVKFVEMTPSQLLNRDKADFLSLVDGSRSPAEPGVVPGVHTHALHSGTPINHDR